MKTTIACLILLGACLYFYRWSQKPPEVREVQVVRIQVIHDKVTVYRTNAILVPVIKAQPEAAAIDPLAIPRTGGDHHSMDDLNRASN